jgi:hypothetical protein
MTTIETGKHVTIPEEARILIMHAVSDILEGCGNSYVNSYTEKWLTHAKHFGAYNGRTTGRITDIQAEWEDWLDENGGLPHLP